MDAILWGSVEVEPEVEAWLDDLSDADFGRVAFHIDRLAREGVRLGPPHTHQLDGPLRELRFYLGQQSDAQRITYYIATGRRIVLLTVFDKQRDKERAEVARARRAMRRCIAEGHTVDEP